MYKNVIFIESYIPSPIANQLLTGLFSPQTSITPLVKIRHQILRLLGTLGGQTNMLLLGNTDPSKAVTWDTNNHLTFAVPFQDMKPNIYLGKFCYNTSTCTAIYFNLSVFSPVYVP